jgi:hypothetical protein
VFVVDVLLCLHRGVGKNEQEDDFLSLSFLTGASNSVDKTFNLEW